MRALFAEPGLERCLETCQACEISLELLRFASRLLPGLETPEREFCKNQNTYLSTLDYSALQYTNHNTTMLYLTGKKQEQKDLKQPQHTGRQVENKQETNRDTLETGDKSKMTQTASNSEPRHGILLPLGHWPVVQLPTRIKGSAQSIMQISPGPTPSQ